MPFENEPGERVTLEVPADQREQVDAVIGVLADPLRTSGGELEMVAFDPEMWAMRGLLFMLSRAPGRGTPTSTLAEKAPAVAGVRRAH